MTRGYFNNQSANKTEKKAEDLKFEIWFADNRDVHMRLQIFKVSLKMLLNVLLLWITKLYVGMIVRYSLR